MTTSIDGILGLQSVNLTPFETRGAKPGTRNSRTTGPVYTEYVFSFTGSGHVNLGNNVLSNISVDSPYNFFNAANLATNDQVVDGTNYYSISSIIDSSSVKLYQNALSTGTHPLIFNRSFVPASNVITGSGQFDSTDSSAVTAVTISSPYALLTARDLTSADIVIDGTSTYTISSIIDATSFFVDKNVLSTGTHPLVFQLTQREYLVEPDAGNNNVLGDASFTAGQLTVIGIGTTWASQLAYGDFIRHDGYMDTYAIQSVIDNTHLTLTRAYTGDTTVGAFTASRVAIGRTKVQFVKNNFSYDNQAGIWKHDATTGSDVTTSAVFMPFTDGMTLKYTPAYSVNNPGLMMTQTVLRKTFARQTQYEMDFFPLPVVPNPEASVEVFINGALKDRYPVGHRDYVLNYSPNPIYETPPPPDQRKICNIMFLNEIDNRVLDQASTENGQMQLLDLAGNNINDLMPGSVSLLYDGTQQTELKDYVLEPNAGMAENIDYTVNEQLVKYVLVDYSKLIDYGFNCSLNGQPQQWSVPPKTNDDIIFQPRTGRMKPQNQDKPGPNDIYEFSYQVDGDMIKNEIVPTKVGALSFRLNRWPVKNSSVFLIKNTVILTEDEDYTVLYQTGYVNLTVPMTAADAFTATYVPLSKQVNDLTYDSSSTTWFCTSQDSRAVIINATNFQFSLLNPNISLDASTSSLLRVYNETRQKDYNLSGAAKINHTFNLAKDSTNTSIGLSSSDTVLVDYKFASEVLEYKPITVNTFVVPGGANSFYLENVNAVNEMPAGAILRLAAPDSQTQYYFFIVSATFTGTNTKIVLASTVPQDITNPSINVSDDPVTFLPVPLSASPVMSGASVFTFKGKNITPIFRPNTLLKFGNDLYSVISASFDHSTYVNSVQVASTTTHDYTDAGMLSSVGYSDCPVYVETATELVPVRPIVTVPSAPGLILSQKGSDIISVISDASTLTIGTVRFDYTSNPTLGDLSSAIQASSLSSLAVNTYAPSWPSRTIVPLTKADFLYKDSSSILSVVPELRFDGTDSTGYTISAAGTIVLNSGLVRGQRYNLDYMGREFLGDTTVSYSANYFVRLPQKSKVTASFEYDNLDQFYIQAMSQRDFFETVSIPRMKNEASQLSGNAGQGGDVPTDDGGSNSSGGIADDEFRRKDDEIECRIFKNIYDFFSNRTQAFGQELYAAEGLKLFNNDGMFTDAQQAYATAGINRIFPNPDWTNFEPERVNPLTGEFVSSGVTFHNGSTTVTSSGALWTKQLPVASDSTCFIGRWRSPTRYQISSITNDSTLVLAAPFTESSTPNPAVGETYTASASYPAYDDDGFMGAKVVGTKSKDFGLGDGIIVQDIFDYTVDDVPYSVTFSIPPSLALVPPPFIFLFWPTFFSASQVAGILNNTGVLSASVEDILVPPGNTKRTSIVLRAAPLHNKLVIGSGSAVIKLGFTPGATSYGNFDKTLNNPESYLLGQEGAHLGPVTNLSSDESDDLVTLVTLGVTNKLDRILLGLKYADDIHSHDSTETTLVGEEIAQLQAEIGALQVIIQEPSLLSYNDATTALNYAQQFLDQSSITMPWPCVQTYFYDLSLSTNWEDKTTDWRWVTDWEDRNLRVLGVDSSGVAVDTTDSTSIIGQSTFILQSPETGNDLRIVGDFTYDKTNWGPTLYYEKDGSAVPGTWTGWDPISGIDLFGLRAPGFFLFPTYEITSTDVVLRDSTLVLGTVSLATHTTVQSLVSAINAVTGFDASIIFNNIGPYPYGSLETVTTTPLSNLIYTPVTTPNQQSLDSSVVFTLDNTNGLFVISRDVLVPAPRYTTTGTNIGFHWTEDEGFKNVSYLYATYPRVSTLMTAIDSYPGFGVHPIHNTNYDYTNLRLLTNIALGGSPGATVYSGSASPAFSMWRDSTYVLGSSSLTLDSSVYAFTSYPTLGDMSTAVEVQPGYTVRSCFAYDYPNGSFVVGSGSVQTGLPGTPFLIASDVNPFGLKMDGTPYISPTYEATASNILLRDGTTVLTSIPYSSFPTLQQLVTQLSSITGFDATLFYHAGAYSYNSLKVVGPTPLNNLFHSPITIQADTTALTITADPPIYSTDATSITFIYSGPVNYKLNYVGYPTLATLESGIDSLPGMNTIGYFDSTYSYGDFEFTSGTLATSSPGTFIHFNTANPAPLFSVFFNEQNFNYSVDTTALNVLWYEDTTASGRTLTYSGNTTVLDMKNAINGIPGLNALGDPSFEPEYSLAFLTSSGMIAPDATIYRGLSACDVTYSTITDRLLDNRVSFVYDRSSEIDLRQTYLDQTRQEQIRSHLAQEEILRTSTGDVGDLWIWANNRWHQRQGCESRLNQIVQQIRSNQSALSVTKMFL